MQIYQFPAIRGRVAAPPLASHVMANRKVCVINQSKAKQEVTGAGL